MEFLLFQPKLSPFLKNGPAAYLPLSVIISLFGLI